MFKLSLIFAAATSAWIFAAALLWAFYGFVFWDWTLVFDWINEHPTASRIIGLISYVFSLLVVTRIEHRRHHND